MNKLMVSLMWMQIYGLVRNKSKTHWIPSRYSVWSARLARDLFWPSKTSIKCNSLDMGYKKPNIFCLYCGAKGWCLLIFVLTIYRRLNVESILVVVRVVFRLSSILSLVYLRRSAGIAAIASANDPRKIFTVDLWPTFGFTECPNKTENWSWASNSTRRIHKWCCNCSLTSQSYVCIYSGITYISQTVSLLRIDTPV